MWFSYLFTCLFICLLTYGLFLALLYIKELVWIICLFDGDSWEDSQGCWSQYCPTKDLDLSVLYCVFLYFSFVLFRTMYSMSYSSSYSYFLLSHTPHLPPFTSSFRLWTGSYAQNRLWIMEDLHYSYVLSMLCCLYLRSESKIPWNIPDPQGMLIFSVFKFSCSSLEGKWDIRNIFPLLSIILSTAVFLSGILVFHFTLASVFCCLWLLYLISIFTLV